MIRASRSSTTDARAAASMSNQAPLIFIRLGVPFDSRSGGTFCFSEDTLPARNAAMRPCGVHYGAPQYVWCTTAMFRFQTDAVRLLSRGLSWKRREPAALPQVRRVCHSPLAG